MRARVIGLGQRAAGDDGAGIAVIDELRRIGAPPGIELTVAAEVSTLVDLLATEVPVVLVDAVLSSPCGQVLELSPSQLLVGGPPSVSSHGLGVGQAIELARITRPDLSPDLRVIGVSIDRPARLDFGLSPEVALAVSRAAIRILELLESEAPRA